MTETENTGRTLPASAPPQTYGARRGERRRPPDRRTTAALVLSALALAISCVSLVLQLRPAPEPEPEPIAVEPEPEPETPTIQYRNHVIPILESVPVNGYDAGTFETDENGFVSYRDAPAGIDVSSYQGEIDWKKVAGSGVSFAMLRAGMRGYTKGGLMTDATFEKNYKGARAAGVDVGVYFFSQATSVEEAEEEADYLFALLDGRAQLIHRTRHHGDRVAAHGGRMVLEQRLRTAPEPELALSVHVAGDSAHEGVVAQDALLQDEGVAVAGSAQLRHEHVELVLAVEGVDLLEPLLVEGHEGG